MMMDFSDPPRRARAESIVPMINVVFLLLIFFLMTSNLAEPEPFEVSPPETSDAQEAKSGGEEGGEPVLYIDENGRFHHAGQEGDSAISSLSASGGGTVKVRADAKLEATALAVALRRMAEAGMSDVELVVRPE